MNRFSAFYAFTMGVILIVLWLYVLIFNPLTNLASDLLLLTFKLIGEILTSAMLIIASMMILQRNLMKRAVFFLATGFLFANVNYLFWNYLIYFEFLSFILSTFAFLSVLIVVGMNYTNWRDLMFLTLGLSIYSMLNLIGMAIKSNHGNAIIFLIPMLVLAVISTFVFYHTTEIRLRTEKNSVT